VSGSRGDADPAADSDADPDPDPDPDSDSDSDSDADPTPTPTPKENVQPLQREPKGESVAHKRPQGRELTRYPILG
jgi:hypothetical protein